MYERDPFGADPSPEVAREILASQGMLPYFEEFPEGLGTAALSDESEVSQTQVDDSSEPEKSEF